MRTSLRCFPVEGVDFLTTDVAHQQRRIIAGHTSSLPGSEGTVWLTSSADGRYLAALPAGGQKLMLFDVKKQSWQELAKTEDIGFANWSANGKYIYFDTGRGKDQAILRVRIADRKLERVASLKEFRRATAGIGPWSGLTPFSNRAT